MADEEGKQFKLFDQPLKCPLCQNDRFWKDRTKLETGYLSWKPEMPGFRLTCTRCRHVLWFED